MSEIKLNQWTWGVVPKLHPEAVVFPGGHKADRLQEDTRPVRYRTLVETYSEHDERWYAVLSLGPPEMPEEELRLPEGWIVTSDFGDESILDYVLVARSAGSKGEDYTAVTVRRSTRAECVRELNRILGGER